MGVDQLLNRLISLQSVEVCTYTTHETVNLAGVCKFIRQRRGLSSRFNVAKAYLRLKTGDGLEGWCGPFDNWSNVTLSALADAIHLIGRKTSIANAFEALKNLWPQNPTICAAVDCALWDLVCRSEGLSLWRSLSREHPVSSNPPFYGSALGLSLEHVDVLPNVLAAGYPVAKWTLNVEDPLEEQLSRIGSLGIGWDSIALDAHGRLSIAQAKAIYEIAPSLSWLEDPFPSWDRKTWLLAGDKNSKFPRLVLGEDINSWERLATLALMPGVYAINLEVERLGITGSILLMKSLNNHDSICHLHGRALIPSSHLAVAYPDVVRRVEIHLAFAIERLATIDRPSSISDPRDIVYNCLQQQGIGVKPVTNVPSIVQAIVS